VKENLSDAQLLELRQRIDLIDDEIVDALNRRAALVQEIWSFKAQIARPLRDMGREAAIEKRTRELSRSPLSPEAMQSIFRCILSEVRPRSSENE